MEKEKTIEALKLFGREDLTDGTYDLPELDSNIEVFMTPRQMIYYMNLETQLKKQQEIIDKIRKEVNKQHTIMGCEVVENWVLLEILEDNEV